MTYRTYIKKDYKPEILWEAAEPRQRIIVPVLVVCFCFALVVTLANYAFDDDSESVDGKSTIVLELEPPSEVERDIYISVSKPVPTSTVENTQAPSILEPEIVEPETPLPAWQTIKVRKGESLSIIFDRMGLGPQVLYKVMNSGDDSKALKTLMPGQQLEFVVTDGKLQTLAFEPNLTNRLEVNKTEQGYSSSLVITELEKRSKQSAGDINSSLFLAGQAAGLSDNLIMQLVGIFGWDIDFVLDIRKGDSFNVIYEERYKDNIKVAEGPILAAEFINRNTAYKAVRYTAPNGETNYFNENGVSMRKAFLRTPLNFSRISSGFNLRRKHPVLNRIRAHRGVDYAAPTGTPIKATGDGTVKLAGRKGGYGRTVILRHGGSRTTLYAHMSKFANRIKTGSKVKQGQIIGYVGKSGLATGPHLHYEFQVNGVHRNPLTVKLPKASSVATADISHFKSQTQTVLAQLQKPSGGTINIATLDQNNTSDNQSVIALDDHRSNNTTVH